MNKEKWIWMPHPGHCIISHQCRFHLNTCVGKYIISTIGEWWPERDSREIHARIYGPKWLSKNKHLKGDNFDRAYMLRFGYEEVGCDRKYETMVFRAKKSDNKCCPYVIDVSNELDFAEYNEPEKAVAGHHRLCVKWSKK